VDDSRFLRTLDDHVKQQVHFQGRQIKETSRGKKRFLESPGQRGRKNGLNASSRGGAAVAGSAGKGGCAEGGGDIRKDEAFLDPAELTGSPHAGLRVAALTRPDYHHFPW